MKYLNVILNLEAANQVIVSSIPQQSNSNDLHHIKLRLTLEHMHIKHVIYINDTCIYYDK